MEDPSKSNRITFSPSTKVTRSRSSTSAAESASSSTTSSVHTRSRSHSAAVDQYKADPSPLAQSTLQDDHFEFITLEDGLVYYYDSRDAIGTGDKAAFGSVFLGASLQDPNLRVAIKRQNLSPKELEASWREAGIYGLKADDEEKALERMGLLRGCGQDSHGKKVLVMEYVPGFSVKELIQRGYITTEAQLQKLAKKVQNAVTTRIHDKGLVHGDMHHGNIRIDIQPRESIGQRVSKLFSFTEGGGSSSSSASTTKEVTSLSPRTPPTSRNGQPIQSIAAFNQKKPRPPKFARHQSTGIVSLGLDKTLSTGSLAPLAHAKSPADRQWIFKPRFIDFGMARLKERLQEKEYIFAVDSDCKRAYDSVWVQRHALKLKQRDTVERRALSVGGLVPDKPPKRSIFARVFGRKQEQSPSLHF